MPQAEQIKQFMISKANLNAVPAASHLIELLKQERRQRTHEDKEILKRIERFNGADEDQSTENKENIFVQKARDAVDKALDE